MLTQIGDEIPFLYRDQMVVSDRPAADFALLDELRLRQGFVLDSPFRLTR